MITNLHGITPFTNLHGVRKSSTDLLQVNCQNFLFTTVRSRRIKNCKKPHFNRLVATYIDKFKLKYNFVETPRKFTIVELSIRKLASSSMLIKAFKAL